MFSKSDIVWGIIGGIAAILFVSHCTGCSSTPIPTARTLTYGFELERCSKEAKSCDESIACENEVRARYPVMIDGKPTPRPLRDKSKGCK